MQVLALVFLLTLSALADPVHVRHEVATAELRARQALPVETPPADPCAAARQIARQPPCLASGDCEALQLWRRGFGAPRVEPLDPKRAAYHSQLEDRAGRLKLPRDVRGLPPTAVYRWPRGSSPPLDQTLRPGFVCPAEADSPN